MVCGVENESPQDVPQWHRAYFELKAILVSDSRENWVHLFNEVE